MNDDALMAVCVTIVTGLDAAEAVRRLGGNVATERASTFDEAFNAYPETAHVLFDALPRGVLLVENNGWEGSRPEVASKLSRDGELVSIYWSVNAHMRFMYAVDGDVVVWFDPLLVEQSWAGSDPEALDEHTNDLEFGEERALEDSFLLAELVTGVAVQREWFDVPHRCVDVTPLAEQR